MGKQWNLPRIPQLQMILFLEQQNQVLESLQMSPVKDMVEMFQ
jgi:hypothetical protein